MILLNESIEKRLEEAHLKITNAMEDSKISSRMSPYGYEEARFSEGLELYKRAYSLHQAQKRDYGEQFLATEAFQGKLDEVNRVYMQHVAIARVALKNHPSLLILAALLGERRSTFHGWLSQTRQFYDRVLGKQEILDLLANYGITAEALTANQQAVEDVRALHKTKTSEAGGAQEATDHRDKALDELEMWTSDLVAIARVATSDSPQLLEKMGITVPS